jgi:neutral trehalase
MQAADRWHQWFYRCRDPQGTGLVALLHPWESGRDNSLDWVDALAAVPADNVGPYQRRDTQHVDASQRPTQFEYDRYVALVQGFRALGWDNSRLHDASPFQVVDPGFNAILIHSDQALARLAQAMGDTALAQRAQARVQKGIAAMDRLWSDAHGQYLCLNRRTGALVDSASVGGLLPVLVLPAGHAHLRALCERLEASLTIAPFGVASHWPSDARFDGKRYWRGPSWLIVNYLLIKGLRDSEEHDLAQQIVAASLRCIEHAGCSEYYHPVTGEALGGGTFTWTAAMVLEFLQFHQPA